MQSSDYQMSDLRRRIRGSTARPEDLGRNTNLPGLFPSAACFSARRQDFRDVVIDHENHDQHEEYEADFEYRLFDLQAQVAPNKHFNEQQHNAPAIQNGNGQQVENCQVQADHGHQQEEGGGPFAGGFAGKLSDADRSFERLRRHAALDDAAQKLEDQ